MKPNAYLINTARGGIIDTVALHKALSEGWIAGAGQDVLPQEPAPPDDPLLKLENIILTPHVAFLSEESTYDAQRNRSVRGRKGVDGADARIGSKSRGSRQPCASH